MKDYRYCFPRSSFQVQAFGWFTKNVAEGSYGVQSSNWVWILDVHSLAVHEITPGGVE